MLEKSKSAQKELKSLLRNAKEYTNKIKNTRFTIKKKEALLQKTADEMKEKLVKALLHKNKIHTEINSIFKQKSKQLGIHSERLELSRGILESLILCSHKLQQHGNPVDYVMTVPVLKRQLCESNPDDITGQINDTDVEFRGVSKKIKEIKVRTEQIFQSLIKLSLISEWMSEWVSEWVFLNEYFSFFYLPIEFENTAK